MSVLASIPSPHNGSFDVFGRAIHMYGLMLLLAIVACIALTWMRWKRRGGDPDLVLRVAVWGVAAGIVGARAYHDITSWNEVPKKWWGPFAVWQGGLGVWGGILLGCLAGAVVVHRSLAKDRAALPAELRRNDEALAKGANLAAGERAALEETQRRLRLRYEAAQHLGVRHFMDAVAPGLLLAQAIGRWGNWWNQELYGKPTSLPWGLKIDPIHRVAGYAQNATFHPTFLYEFLYDLLGVGVLLLIGSRFRIRPPALFALYVAIYTFGRFFEELLRIDPSHHFLGLRLNAWVSIVLFLASAAFFVWWQFIRPAREPGTGAPSGRIRRPEGPAMAIPKGRVR